MSLVCISLYISECRTLQIHLFNNIPLIKRFLSIDSCLASLVLNCTRNNFMRTKGTLIKNLLFKIRIIKLFSSSLVHLLMTRINWKLNYSSFALGFSWMYELTQAYLQKHATGCKTNPSDIFEKLFAI